MRSACEPFEIQNLLPLSTQSSPSRCAVSSIAAGSDPTFGSVSAKAPTFFAEKRSGNHRWRCSSLPKLQTAVPTSESCTVSAAVNTDGLAPPIASHSSTYETLSMPAPPCSSGKGPARRPFSASLRMISSGNVSSLARSRTCGRISRSANDFAVL